MSAGTLGLTALSLVLSLASGARAETSHFELDYAAEPTCPDEGTFRALVEKQLASYDANRVQGVPGRVQVRLQASDDGFVASVELARLDGTRSSRELRALTCREAGTALAFVVAMALGGRDAESEPAERVVNDTPTPAPPPLPPAAPPEPAPPPARAASKPAALPPPSNTTRYRSGVALELGLRGGLGPGSTPTITEAVAVAVEQRAPLWVWHSRLSVMRDEAVTQRNRAGSLRLSWWSVGVVECPLALERGPWRVLPCVSAHVGRMGAKGEPAPLAGAQNASKSETWFDAGLGGRGELAPFSHWLLVVGGDVVLPLTRYRFRFDPSIPLYDVPVLAGAGFVGLETRFP